MNNILKNSLVYKWLAALAMFVRREWDGGAVGCLVTKDRRDMKTKSSFAYRVFNAPLSLINSIPDIDTDDIGALANIPREIAGVEIGICVKEKKAGVFKASLRSSDNFDAAEIARRFGGGGHARAAGCSFNGTTMEKAVESIANACIEAVEKLV